MKVNMNNLSNDTYIQRTNKGDLALIAKPPIDIKLRHYLHEIPVLSEISVKEDLVNLSQLYINVNEKNPYEFRRIIDDIVKKGWVIPISEEVLLSLFENKKELPSDVVSDHNINVVENLNEETIVVEEIVVSTPEKKEKELSEWLLEEKLKKEAEELKKEEVVEEEEIPEIPWDNPYTSLEDFLSDGKKDSKITIKKEEIDFKEDYNNSWSDEQQDDSSSYSKSKSEKLKEQLSLMKKDKKRKTDPTTTQEKSTSEDSKKNKGFFGRVGSIFKKGE